MRHIGLPHFRTVTPDLASQRKVLSDSPARHHHPFDIETMDPIEPPWKAIKEWIPDDEPDLDWFNRPRNTSNPDPDGIDQRPTWHHEEIPLNDGRTLVLEYS